MKGVKLIPSDLDEKLKALIKERHCLMIYYNPTEETVSLNFPLKQGKLYHADTVSELLEKVVEDYQPKSELLNDLGDALNPNFYLKDTDKSYLDEWLKENKVDTLGMEDN